VILDEAQTDIWLRTDAYSPEEALALLKPDPGLEWYPVSTVGTIPRA
jgi:putative SOS response-associated peptidase YedK